MCDSEAEKILFILNKHERAYRRLKPVYMFLKIGFWISPVLLIVYLFLCIFCTEYFRIGFSIVCAAFYFLFIFAYFSKYFFTLNRANLLYLMDITRDSPAVKQEVLNRLLSGKRMTRGDEMDICRLLKTKEEEKIRQSELNNIRGILDEKRRRA